MCHRHKTYDNFEERAGAAYGYKVDPLYWDKKGRRAGKVTIVIICAIWCIFGTILQFAFVFSATKRSTNYMDQETAILNREVEHLRMNAIEVGSTKGKDSETYEKFHALQKKHREHMNQNLIK